MQPLREAPRPRAARANSSRHSLHPSSDKIDIELFFGLLKKKLGNEQRKVITTALAEPVRRAAVRRVLSCSEEPPNRIVQLRKVLHTRSRSLKDQEYSSIRDGIHRR